MKRNIFNNTMKTNGRIWDFIFGNRKLNKAKALSSSVLNTFSVYVFTFLLVLPLMNKLNAQSCPTGTFAATCCPFVNMSMQMTTVSVGGNQVQVTITPSFTVPPANDPICESTVGDVYYQFGDGTSYTQAVNPNSSTYPSTTHVYTLSNACISNTFLVTANLQLIPKSGDIDCFNCGAYTQTVGISSLNQNMGITFTNTACKTFSFSYTGISNLQNVTWTFGNGNQSTPQNGNGIIHNYPTGGNYVVGMSAQGFSNCPTYTQVTVVDPLVPDFNYTITNVCNPTAGLTLEISNYTNTAQYQWNINGQIFAASPTPSLYTQNLAAVSNTVKLIQSMSGCVNVVSKPVYMGVPTATFLNAGTPSQTLCAGSFLSVYNVPSGGSQYVWNIIKPNGQPETPQYGMNPYYLFTNPGTYSVSLTINNTYTVNGSPVLCSSTSSVMPYTVYSIPNPTFVINPQLCNNTASISLATLPINNTVYTSYTLSYSTGSTYQGTGVIPNNQLSYAFSSNGVKTIGLNLSNNGCTSTYSQNIAFTNLPTLNLQNPYPMVCAGLAGNLNAQVSGTTATTPVTYTWSGPGGFTSNAQTINPTLSGSYTISAGVAGVCPITLTASTTFSVLAPVSATVIGVSPIACNATTTSGTISIAVDIQQQGFYIGSTLYAANPSAATPTQIVLSNLVNGTNVFTLKNALLSDCQANIVLNANYNNPILTLNTTQPQSCIAGALGTVVATANPNIGTITWYNSQNVAIGTGGTQTLPPGTYQVKVVNGFCSATQFVSIAPPVINASKSGANGVCPGNTAPITINAQFSPSPNSATFNYTWLQLAPTPTANLGSGSSNVKNLGAGQYQVNISASNSCSTSLGFTIVEYDPITVTVTAAPPSCEQAGFANAQVSGGDGIYTYNWLVNSVSQNSLGNVASLSFSVGSLTAPTTISLAVNDQSGCSGGAAPTPSVLTPPTAVSLQACGATPGFTYTGPSNATGISSCDIKACVQGGQSPYTFEWYKTYVKRKKIQWHFYYLPYTPSTTATPSIAANTVFIGDNGTQTVSILNPTLTIPSSSAAAVTSSINLFNSADSSQTTVMYPYWNFTVSTTTATPVLNNGGTAAFGNSTTPSTVLAHYYPVIETVTLQVEDLMGAYSGTTGTTYPHEDFEDGDYVLYVTDANGCRYRFTIGNLSFPKPTKFNVGFSFVFGLGPKTQTVAPTDPVLQEDMLEAAAELSESLNACLQKQQKQLEAAVKAKCEDISQLKDGLLLTYSQTEHHHTLYYYDRAGQLTKTIPPEGVEYLKTNEISNVLAARSSSVAAGNSANWNYTPHRMPSTYRYNSFGQLLTQSTPDGGASAFIYDSKNRLRFSQNAKQAAQNPAVYSYTKYDELGRIIEVGESSLLTTLSFTATPTTQQFAANTSVADNTLHPSSGTKQVTRTYYSQPSGLTYYGLPQQFLQNRVSYTSIDPNPLVVGDEHSTHYSYDTHGNVEWLVQDDAGGIGKNYVKYDYDLVSGKVIQVSYNENRLDRFYHKYEYDAENRLKAVYTSRNGELWDKDGGYDYYAHGPLKRSTLGEDHVQGLDYVYTLHGWIKGINSPDLNTANDPGNDNSTAFVTSASISPQEKTAADRHGMVLNYYNGDYTSNTSNYLTASATHTLYNMSAYNSSNAPSLFNGNISSWVQSQLNTTSTQPILPRGDMYQYDLLNRIKQSSSLEKNTSTTTGWSAIGTSTATFKTEYDYDANGNILSLKRFDNLGTLMDDFEYSYDNGAKIEAKNQNRLQSVKDVNTSFLSGRGDLEDNHAYTYDAIGNLITEIGKERLNPTNATNPSLYTVQTDIKWTVYGKMEEVAKTIDPSGLNYKERLRFSYDASGNRIKKEYWKDAIQAPQTAPNGTVDAKEVTTTYYVRDAQGNVMGTYKRYFDISTNLYKIDLTEEPIYGSDRIGQNTKVHNLVSSSTATGLAQPINGIVVNSEYQNWLTGVQSNSLLPGAGNNLCDCKLVAINNNTVTANQNMQFLGIAHNGIAVAEDKEGNLQFYAVLAKKYLGGNDACLLFDKTGRLIKNTENISTTGSIDPNSKPIIVNVPGTSIYQVIYLNANKKLVKQLVDMSLQGYGALATNPMGEVVGVNVPLTAPVSGTVNYGYHLAGLENHISNQNIVYASRFVPNVGSPTTGTTDIVAFDFTTNSVTPQETVLYSIAGCGSTETGELQLSPHGNKLVWYQHDKSISGFAHRQGYIYSMSLDPSKLAITGNVDIKPLSNAGNYGNGALEVMTNGSDVLYSQRGIFKEGAGLSKYAKNVWKYDPLTSITNAINPDNAASISYLLGNIKRGKDGKYYIPNLGEPASVINSYDGAAFNGSITVNQLAYKFSASLPTQVWKVYKDPTQTLSSFGRTVGDKSYELKDHLANVKVVISDEKVVNDLNASNTVDNSDSYEPVVLNYTDYYLGGFEMPTRKYNLGSTVYRYNYQDQEKDPELFGGSGLTYKYRAEDARLNRFFSTDPLEGKYPWNSPYAFAENRLTDGVELEGAEFINTTSTDITDTKTNKDGSGEISIGDQKYSYSSIIEHNGNKFYNVGKHIYKDGKGIISIDGKESEKLTTFFVTQSQIESIFPKSKSTGVSVSLASYLNSYMAEYGIDTKLELSHFLAQSGVETGGFRTLNATENLDYNFNNVCSIMGGLNHPDVDDNPWPYINNPEAIGDKRYEGGYNYRGRGILQLTHLGNYKAFEKHHNSKYSPALEIVKNPDLVQTNSFLAVISGLHYFNSRVMDKKGVDLFKSTNAAIDKVTYKVNGGYIQKKERRNLFQKTLLELGK